MISLREVKSEPEESTSYDIGTYSTENVSALLFFDANLYTDDDSDFDSDDDLPGTSTGFNRFTTLQQTLAKVPKIVSPVFKSFISDYTKRVHHTKLTELNDIDIQRIIAIYNGCSETPSSKRVRGTIFQKLARECALSYNKLLDIGENAKKTMTFAIATITLPEVGQELSCLVERFTLQATHNEHWKLTAEQRQELTKIAEECQKERLKPDEIKEIMMYIADSCNLSYKFICRVLRKGNEKKDIKTLNLNEEAFGALDLLLKNLANNNAVKGGIISDELYEDISKVFEFVNNDRKKPIIRHIAKQIGIKSSFICGVLRKKGLWDSNHDDSQLHNDVLLHRELEKQLAELKDELCQAPRVDGRIRLNLTHLRAIAEFCNRCENGEFGLVNTSYIMQDIQDTVDQPQHYFTQAFKAYGLNPGGRMAIGNSNELGNQGSDVRTAEVQRLLDEFKTTYKPYNSFVKLDVPHDDKLIMITDQCRRDNVNIFKVLTDLVPVCEVSIFTMLHRIEKRKRALAAIHEAIENGSANNFTTAPLPELSFKAGKMLTKFKEDTAMLAMPGKRKRLYNHHYDECIRILDRCEKDGMLKIHVKMVLAHIAEYVGLTDGTFYNMVRMRRHELQAEELRREGVNVPRKRPTDLSDKVRGMIADFKKNYYQPSTFQKMNQEQDDLVIAIEEQCKRDGAKHLITAARREIEEFCQFRPGALLSRLTKRRHQLAAENAINKSSDSEVSDSDDDEDSNSRRNESLAEMFDPQKSATVSKTIKAMIEDFKERFVRPANNKRTYIMDIKYIDMIIEIVEQCRAEGVHRLEVGRIKRYIEEFCGKSGSGLKKRLLRRQKELAKMKKKPNVKLRKKSLPNSTKVPNPEILLPSPEIATSEGVLQIVRVKEEENDQIEEPISKSSMKPQEDITPEPSTSSNVIRPQTLTVKPRILQRSHPHSTPQNLVDDGDIWQVMATRSAQKSWKKPRILEPRYVPCQQRMITKPQQCIIPDITPEEKPIKTEQN